MENKEKIKEKVLKSKEWKDLRDYLNFYQVKGSRCFYLKDKLLDIVIQKTAEAIFLKIEKIFSDVRNERIYGYKLQELKKKWIEKKEKIKEEVRK